MGLRAELNNNSATAITTSTTNKMLGSYCSEANCNRKASPKPTQRLSCLTPKVPTSNDKILNMAAACITTVKSRTTCTFRSNSASDLLKNVTYARPQTLNVHKTRETPSEYTNKFLREVLNAWRAKARCNVVPTEHLEELFQVLYFHPNKTQISEMVQTAKMMARKGCRRSNGLTFGEFSALAAELKRFRSSIPCSGTTPIASSDKLNSLTSSLQNETDKIGNNNSKDCISSDLRSTKSFSNVEDCRKTTKNNSTPTDKQAPVEVFLGGSCNPTTWRADVAIPALKKLGISFYNPQVSDWTPDLIELEHRAKEKASVLFFVMDSETRASAGAIEAAHIAGQNCKQLVLVLHPYKSNQHILNEPISQQEFQDLMRNQLILRELVTRRGLPVLDNIPMGLQRTKEILAGIRDPPPKISSILVVLRGAFDRVCLNDDFLTVEQCQRALSYLGYAQSLLNLENLKGIIATQRDNLKALQNEANEHINEEERPNPNCSHSKANGFYSQNSSSSVEIADDVIDFELFCVISAYLSVLQQEIHESGCISPIKGTNVPPPPVYLTNMQAEESFSINSFLSRNISRNSSNNSVPSSSGSIIEEKANSNDVICRSRDSGTSSPQPLESRSSANLSKSKTKILVNYESVEQTEFNTGTATITTTTTRSSNTILDHINQDSTAVEDESDSNDSVFSSNSSINSFNCSYNYSGSIDMFPQTFSNVDFRDVYLGGSCMLRTKWRQEIAVPYFKSKGVSFHLPALHESIPPPQQFKSLSSSSSPSFHNQQQQPQQQPHSQLQNQTQKEKLVSEESALLPIRSNLYNPVLLDASRVLLFVITNETRSLAPMTLAAHCIGLMYNVVLCVQMLPEDCIIGNEKLTPIAIKDYNRGRSYLIDLAKRQGVPVFNDLKAALECTVEKVKTYNNRNNAD